MGLFKAAVESAPKTETKAKKGTNWSLTSVADMEHQKQLSHSVAEVIRIKAEMDKLEGQMTPHKARLCNHAFDETVDTVVATGQLPETPMSILNSEGQSVTYVIQNRSNPVSDQQVEMMNDAVGADKAADLILTQTTFGFDPLLLARDGVLPIIEKHLEAALAELVAENTMAAEETANFITAEQKRMFRPRVTDFIGQYCGKDRVAINKFFQALGSSNTRYIKS